MVSNPIRLLVSVNLSSQCTERLKTSPYGPFELQLCESLEQAWVQLGTHAFDAMLLSTELAATASDDLGMLQTATLVVGHELEPEAVLAWLQKGAQDVLTATDLQTDSLPQRVRAAVERKRIETEVRKSYATDLATGVPHQQQLIEHMSHLLALREREPSAMAVLGLRIEGLPYLKATLGLESANVLRRKVAVRLRAGVRASDVVAAIGDQAFAVLLGSILAAEDAERVAAKLSTAVLDAFSIAGKEVQVGLALGIAQYPHDGSQPDALLSRAMNLAASAPVQGSVSVGALSQAETRVRQAANDD